MGSPLKRGRLAHKNPRKNDFTFRKAPVNEPSETRAERREKDLLIKEWLKTHKIKRFPLGFGLYGPPDIK